MNISIIGAGNGGQAFAAWCASLGHHVSIYELDINKLNPIIDTKTIILEGLINLTSRVDLITDDINKVVSSADLIMVTTPASAHAAVARSISSFLHDGQTVVLNPGRTFGALEFDIILKENRPNLSINLAEAQTLVFACRLHDQGRVNIIGVKDKVLMAGRTETETKRVIDILKPIFSCFAPAKNFIETGLLNVGAILHPSITLFNAATIERNQTFFFYRDMTPNIAGCIEQLDAERIAIAKAYDLDLMPLKDWLLYAYPNTKGETLIERMVNNPAYHDILAPGSIFVRQLTEDIPTGLVPMSELGKLAGISTPLMDGFISLSSALLNINLKEKGRTLKRLGLKNLSKDELEEKIS